MNLKNLFWVFEISRFWRMLSGMHKKPPRPRDANQLGKLIVDLATGSAKEPKPVDDGKDPAAVSLGRKGGAARASALSKKKRSEIAKKAAASRWKSKK